jgi:hypothetical protein
MEIAGAGMGGGNITVNLSLPNVTRLSDLSQHEVEIALRDVFTRAARSLGRNGHTWPMNPSSNI